MKTSLTLLALALAAPLAGQSASSFVPQQAAEDAEVAEPAAPAPDLAMRPSRLVGDDIDAYVRSVISSLSISKRDIDPFGRHQDPDYKPPTPVVKRDPARPQVQKLPQLSFQDIVNGIEVNAVIPSKQIFMAGGRTFRVGERIPLDTGRGKLLTVQVVSVSSNSVSFRNTLSGETATVRLDIAPGMQRGNDVKAPPGVVTPDEVPPLNVVPINGLSTSR